MTLADALKLPTISVPEAGRIFYGLSRSNSYEAARRGEIPTIKIGGRFKVPVAPLAEKLGLRGSAGRGE